MRFALALHTDERYLGRAEKINITVPARLLRRIDIRLFLETSTAEPPTVVRYQVYGIDDRSLFVFFESPVWSFDGMIEDARLGFEAGVDIANDPKLPAWTPGDEFEAARKGAAGVGK